MKKKVLSILLMAAMTMSILVGCGAAKDQEKEVSTGAKVESIQKTEKATTQSTTQSTTQPTEVGETLEDATLKVWLVGTGKQKDADAVWAHFNEQLKDYLPNTTVEFTAFSFDEYATKWSTAMAAGEVVDLAWSGYVLNLNNEIEMGTFTPLTNLVDTYLQDAVDSFGKVQLDMHYAADGELYVFPCWQGLAKATQGISFQADTVALMEDGWIEKFEKMLIENGPSLDVEKHREVYEEFSRYLQVCKDNGMLKAGISPNTFSNWYITSFAMDALGSGLTGYIVPGDDTFTIYPMYNNELNKLYWEYIARWYDAGYIRQDIASVDKGYNEFKVGDPDNSVITYNGGFKVEDPEAFFTAKYDMEIETAVASDVTWVGPATSTSWCIPSTSSDVERAAMLLNLILSDEGKELYQTLVYGIEGTHWKDNGDGTATTLCGDGQPTADWAYGQVNWVMGNIQNGLITQTDDPGDAAYKKSLEAGALQNPLKVANFSMNVSEIEAQWSNLKAINSKYNAMFAKGYLGLEGFEKEYANYVKELEDAGIKEYYAEFQKQVDAFVAERGLSWK